MVPEPLSVRAVTARVDPAALFLSLEASSPDVFWLDAGAGAAEGWSFVGTGVVDDFPVEVRIDGRQAEGIPFSGGRVGWCDYETGARNAGAPAAEAMGSAWMRATRMAAFDHATGETWALAGAADLDPWTQVLSAPRRTASVPPITTAPAVSARHTPSEYAALIEQCRRLIRAGIAYQLCLTTRFTVPGSHDAVAAYLRLRDATPAHHGGFIRIGGRSLLSASPEQFLHVEGGTIRTKPIKGTRPRGADAESDAATECQVIPPPAPTTACSASITTLRITIARSTAPSSPTYPKQPA